MVVVFQSFDENDSLGDGNNNGSGADGNANDNANDYAALFDGDNDDTTDVGLS